MLDFVLHRMSRSHDIEMNESPYWTTIPNERPPDSLLAAFLIPGGL